MENQKMKFLPLGSAVLIEQKFTTKNNKILTLGKEKEDSMDMSMKILELGPDVEKGTIKVGDEVILAEYATPLYSEQVYKSENILIGHILMAFTSIVGIRCEE